MPVQDVHVDAVIVHLLDPRGPRGLVLSERALPLDVEKMFVDYIATHIANALDDPAVRSARFLAPLSTDARAPDAVCAALLEGTTALVEGSHLLATRLYDIIAADGRISSGNVVVCLYRQGDDPSGVLALIKVDPSEALRQTTHHDAAGLAYESIDVVENVLPSTRERLQKCAFVFPRARRRDFDLVLLDRQTSAPAADFFMKTFLCAELAHDARQSTDLLYKACASAQNALRGRLTPRENEALEAARTAAFGMTTIDVAAWTDALPLPPQYRAEMRAAIETRLPDRSFALDPTYAAQVLARRRRFHGDDGLVVAASAAFWDSDAVTVERIERPGETPYFRVTLTTEEWRETPR